MLLYILGAGYIAVSLLSESASYLAENLDLVLLNAIWIPFSLVSFHFLIDYAGRTVIRFREQLDFAQEDFERLHYRITTIPQGAAVIIPIITGIIIYADILWGNSLVVGDLQSLTALILAPLYPILGFSFIPLLIYLTLRQLYLVDFMYSRVAEVNIFHLQPLYIPSGLTARTGVVWILYLNANILISGVLGGISPALFFVVAVAQTFFAILAFLVPLWGIHRKILTEKEAALQENGALIERAYQELQGLLENKDYQSMDKFNSGVSSLLAFQAELKKVPTWPWQPQTLRGFLSAVFLPLALWLIQRILTQLV